MTDTQAQEAARLADKTATLIHDLRRKPIPLSDVIPHLVALTDAMRSQAARIAELESRVHTCGPTCSKAGCINRRLTAERDALRAELARMREPLSDEQIRSMCKQGWVFETVKQWVRVTEAAHGITKTGGGV